MNSFLLSLGALVVVLGVLVFVHEAGHFVAAKWAGIYVHRFSLGLGPPIKALSFRRGETDYAISWLPLGGYVKMASREEEATSAALEGATPDVPVAPDRVFEAKPVWKRMIVILAGVTMNLVFAYVVYVGLALQHGRDILRETRVGAVDTTALPPGAEALRELRPGDRIAAVNGQPVTTWNGVLDGIQSGGGRDLTLSLADGRTFTLPIHADAIERRVQVGQALLPYTGTVVGAAIAGYPAAGAGLRAGDTVLAIDGNPVHRWTEMQALLDARPGDTVQVALGRAGGRSSITLVTRAETVRDSSGATHRVGRMGVTPQLDYATERYTFVGALGAGWSRTLDACQLIVRTVRGILAGRVSGKALGGPILIAQQAGESARLGLGVFLSFMALISVNLAVLNLLPIPVLDGGQFVFLLAEGVLRRPLSLRLRERLTMAGLAAIVALMVFVFWNDIGRLVHGFRGT